MSQGEYESILHPQSSREKGTPLSSSVSYKQKREKRQKAAWLLGGFALVVVIVLAAVLGGVFGYRSTHSSSSSSSSSTSKRNASEAAAAERAAGGDGNDPSIPANLTVTPLAEFDWSKDKAIGVSLGNWLVLERWMDEEWMVGNTNNDSVDEWTFSQTLGSDRARQVLSEHWASWVTEDDVETLYVRGFNQIRVPTGYWMWIGTEGDEPYVTEGQLPYLERLLGWCYVRGMRVVIDIHALPGSQNGEQTSGHLTTNPTFFSNDHNLERGRQTVRRISDWIAKNPYRSVIVALEVANEPRPTTDQAVEELTQHYTYSYDYIQNSSYPVPIFMHHGYVSGNRMAHWRSFVSERATNPPSLLYEDHPYPGNFPLVYDPSKIIGATCYWGREYVDYPVPIVISEWTLYNGNKTHEFEHEFYNTQLATWSWSAGGFYWSFKLKPSQAQLAQGLDYSQYSLMTVLTNTTTVATSPSSFGIASTVDQNDVTEYLNHLNGSCGSRPDDSAPYANGTASISAWDAGQRVMQTASTAVLSATGTSAAASTNPAVTSSVSSAARAAASSAATATVRRFKRHIS